MKITTLLVSYKFRLRQNGSIIVDADRSGSIVFKYSDTKDYANNYGDAYRSFFNQLPIDYCTKHGIPPLGLQVEFIYFNCLHSLTEELLMAETDQMTVRDYAFLILGRCGTSDKLVRQYIADLNLPYSYKEVMDAYIDCLHELPQEAITPFANVNYGIFKR